MNNEAPKQNQPPEQDTNALEDIILFLANIPARTRSVFNKIKQSVLSWRSKLARQSHPADDNKTKLIDNGAPTTPAIKTTGEPEADLAVGLTSGEVSPTRRSHLAVGLAYHGLTSGSGGVDEAAGPDEAGFAPITRKNFFKHPIFWARFLGYAIPLSFLLYVLYINYLPFGYHKTFTINVGSPNDTTPSEFYLQPSKDLSDRMTNPDGTTYRTLNGMATAVFKPNVVLNNAKITVDVKADEGISIIPPTIDFNPNSVKWDYAWDFTKGVPEGLTNINDRAFAYEGGTYFDGTARVELPKSADMFEDGPFTVYVEWMPINNNGSNQQILGHFNWELWQNPTYVLFQVGRMNNLTGQAYNIKFPIEQSFFQEKHFLIASYNPSDSNGYIELNIDGKLIGRTYIGNGSIWKQYGNENLSMGWTPHNYQKSHYFEGKIFKVNYISKNIISYPKIITLFLRETDEKISMTFISNNDIESAINRINLDVKKQ